MRRALTGVLAGLLVGLAPSAPATATSAARAGCVSKGEFAKVKVGMTKKRVRRTFGTPGIRTGLGGANELRYYRPCKGSGTVQVVFTPAGRVVSKSGNWFS